MKFYTLEHTYEYEIVDDIKVEETKFIGLYRTERKAIAVKNRLKNIQGFKRFPEDCFVISETIVDKTRWTEGFITWDSETMDWIE